jgi:ferredoxin
VWLPRIDPNICIGSGNCIDLCPTGALGLVNGNAVLIYPDLCTYCAACESVCPVGAVALPYLICKAEESHEQTSQS